MLREEWEECLKNENCITEGIDPSWLNGPLKSNPEWTPLKYICLNFNGNNCQSALNALVKAKIHVNVSDEDGLNPLMWILSREDGFHHGECLDILLKAGVPVDRPDEKGQTALMYAIEVLEMYGDIALVNQLIKAGANVHHKTKNDDSVLDYAISSQDRELIESLIEKNVDVNSENSKGETALIKAAFWGLDDVVETLVHKGAVINHSSKKETALMSAIKMHYLNIALFLIEAGADWTLKDYKGMDVLSFLEQSSRHTDHFKDEIKALIERKVLESGLVEGVSGKSTLRL